MQLTTIAFRRLINMGNYENMAVEMTANLEPGEQALNAIHELAWIVTQALADMLGEDQAWRLGESDVAELRKQGKLPTSETPERNFDDIPY